MMNEELKIQPEEVSGPYSCRCTTISSGQEKATKNVPRDGTNSHKRDGEWNRSVEVVMLQFAESGHLVFRVTSVFVRKYYTLVQRSARNIFRVHSLAFKDNRHS